MRIISASRRTDIPAFHANWFIDCVNAGSVTWRNPFGGKEITTSLAPEDVSAIVFWSKDYSPLLPHLPDLYERSYRFLFHFTITGLPSVFEPNVPPVEVTIEAARALAEQFGSKTVLWRYDPVLISSITPPEYHRRRFAELASRLAGHTTRCYFSFPTFYSKASRRFAKLEREMGIRCIDPPVEEKIALAHDLADIADGYRIRMLTCCGDYLLSGRIEKAHCIDAELLSCLYPDRAFAMKHKGTRGECGCYESTDIGAYGTCRHGCVYCYAEK